MSNKVKDINIINRRYYFFNDTVNIENFESSNTKIDEMKQIQRIFCLLYWTGDNQRIHICL